jgi:hypothetical protein
MPAPDELRDRARAAQERARALVESAQQIHRELEQADAPLSGAQRLQVSEYARLQARLQTMPVIEQAKGIIMAQSHCAPAEAFDLLRRASQRSNVPVRELAAAIVSDAAGRRQSGTRTRRMAVMAALQGRVPDGRRRASDRDSPAVA